MAWMIEEDTHCYLRVGLMIILQAYKFTCNRILVKRVSKGCFLTKINKTLKTHVSVLTSSSCLCLKTNKILRAFPRIFPTILDISNLRSCIISVPINMWLSKNNTKESMRWLRRWRAVSSEGPMRTFHFRKT